MTDQYVYAPVFAHVSHAVNRLVGLDGPGAVGVSVEAYAVRHLVVAACGLLGVLAVGGHRAPTSRVVALGPGGRGHPDGGPDVARTVDVRHQGRSRRDRLHARDPGPDRDHLLRRRLRSRRRRYCPRSSPLAWCWPSGHGPGLWPALAVSLLLAAFVSLRLTEGSAPRGPAPPRRDGAGLRHGHRAAPARVPGLLHGSPRLAHRIHEPVVRLRHLDGRGRVECLGVHPGARALHDAVTAPAGRRGWLPDVASSPSTPADSAGAAGGCSSLPRPCCCPSWPSSSSRCSTMTSARSCSPARLSRCC